MQRIKICAIIIKVLPNYTPFVCVCKTVNFPLTIACLQYKDITHANKSQRDIRHSKYFSRLFIYAPFWLQHFVITSKWKLVNYLIKGLRWYRYYFDGIYMYIMSIRFISFYVYIQNDDIFVCDKYALEYNREAIWDT